MSIPLLIILSQSIKIACIDSRNHFFFGFSGVEGGGAIVDEGATAVGSVFFSTGRSTVKLIEDILFSTISPFSSTGATLYVYLPFFMIVSVVSHFPSLTGIYCTSRFFQRLGPIGALSTNISPNFLSLHTATCFTPVPAVPEKSIFGSFCIPAGLSAVATNTHAAAQSNHAPTAAATGAAATGAAATGAAGGGVGHPAGQVVGHAGGVVGAAGGVVGHVGGVAGVAGGVVLLLKKFNNLFRTGVPVHVVTHGAGPAGGVVGPAGGVVGHAGGVAGHAGGVAGHVGGVAGHVGGVAGHVGGVAGVVGHVAGHVGGVLGVVGPAPAAGHAGGVLGVAGPVGGVMGVASSKNSCNLGKLLARVEPIFLKIPYNKSCADGSFFSASTCARDLMPRT